MNCTNCGNNLPENSVFCPSCGTAVSTAQTPQTAYNEQTMYQSPVDNSQAMYQQPANNAQAIYQQPVNNAQAIYQQPADNTQSMYQPPVDNSQAMYQQPTNNAQAIYQQPVDNLQATYQQPADNTQSMYQQPASNGQGMYQQGYNPYAAPQKKKSKAPWIALGVSLFLLIVIIAIVIVLLVSCGPDQSTPDATVKSFIEALSNNEQEDCIDTIYPAVLGGYSDMGIDEKTAFLMLRSAMLSEFSASTVTFSNLTINERETMDSQEIMESNQEMSNVTGYIAMSSGVELSGTVIAHVNGSPINCEWVATLVLADGDYYIIDFSFDY